jgi:hypothetical protein
MSTYSLINNGDTGLSVRTTLNSLLTDINTGAVGSAGTSGVSGSSGTSGVSGSSGTSGANGSSGTSGQAGSSGTSGTSATLPSKTPITLTNDATISWNYSNSYNAEIGLTGNSDLSITSATAGDYGTLKITHTNANTRMNFATASNKFASGTYSFTSATNSVDIYSFYYDGTNYNWNYNLDFK